MGPTILARAGLRYAIKVHGSDLSYVVRPHPERFVPYSLEGTDGAAGILETNWSDETYRKMSTTVAVHGSKGKLVVDRQELKLYLREGAEFERYAEGWNTRYITDLQKPVSFYLRGEEYSAQVESFLEAVRTENTAHENSFASAYETDRIVDLILQAGGKAKA